MFRNADDEKRMRNYQRGFFTSFASVRDRERRLRKAMKIVSALREWGGQPLCSAVCLDIGCSSGIITAALATQFYRILGIEYDPVALVHAPRDIPSNTFFVQADAMRLPVMSESVDIALCSQVYEHVPDDVRLIHEIYRILKPGGVVFFSGPNKLYPVEPHYFLPFLHWLPSRWADLYLKLFRKGDHYYERSRTIWSLRRLVAEFSIRDVTGELIKREPDLLASQRWSIHLHRMPLWVWHILAPVLPNFNWLLFKPRNQTPAVSRVGVAEPGFKVGKGSIPKIDTECGTDGH
jgi:SAM-dependent methyltransferase